MGKLKNGMKSSQLWQIISPLIFIENLWNFAQSFLNSSKIWEYFLLKKIKKKWGKNAKNLLGVFSQVKIGLKKTSRQKNFFLATLVALDFTLVSETLGRSFKLA